MQQQLPAAWTLPIVSGAEHPSAAWPVRGIRVGTGGILFTVVLTIAREMPSQEFDAAQQSLQATEDQAGVSLPRTAEAQWEDAITHIPLSDLQPGDLVFWNDGTTSARHVAIYVGGSEVIHTPHTGADLSYSSIWTNGLVTHGAGRP